MLTTVGRLAIYLFTALAVMMMFRTVVTAILAQLAEADLPL